MLSIFKKILDLDNGLRSLFIMIMICFCSKRFLQ